MVLLLDNYDSFTFNLKDYLEQLGAEVTVVRNDAIDLSDENWKSVKGLVISPGPGTPGESGSLMDVLNHFLYKIPVLGICLGHQAIGTYFGASLIKTTPMHGKVSEITTNGHKMWEGAAVNHNICRYHSLVLDSPLPEPLEITATTKDGKVMALAHKEMPVWGVQYHPEAILSENGLNLLKNWLKMVYLQQ